MVRFDKIAKGCVPLKDRFKVVKCKSDWIIRNENGDYNMHGHFRSPNVCRKLIQLMEHHTVPDSPYLRESVLRLTLDRQYKQKVADKIRKDAGKQKYYNINKGV